MKTLLPILLLSILFAWLTERTTEGTFGKGNRQSGTNKFLFLALLTTLVLPVGLRQEYNDTLAYINHFNNSPTLKGLLNSGGLELLGNPAFEIYTAIIRSFTDNYHIYLMLPAVFVQYSFVTTIRRYSSSFTLGIGIYICLGTYLFSMAALKQTIAMAILLFAVDALIARKNVRFYLLVFVAFLVHTYALVFLILPLFTVKPWSPRSLLVLLGAIYVMRNFNTVLEGFMEFANESGKNVSSDEIIGVAGINPIRVAVYSIPPLFALVFRRYLFADGTDREHNIIVNMSFITLSIMSIGLVNAANMFGRMGQYFEFGVICGLPWMLTKPFDKQSERLVSLIAILCFAGYFCYANLIQINFDANYSRITVLEFLERILQELIFR